MNFQATILPEWMSIKICELYEVALVSVFPLLLILLWKYVCTTQKLWIKSIIRRKSDCQAELKWTSTSTMSICIFQVLFSFRHQPTTIKKQQKYCFEFYLLLKFIVLCKFMILWAECVFCQREFISRLTFPGFLIFAMIDIILINSKSTFKKIYEIA